VLEHHQRLGGRLRIAEAAVSERYVSDLEREVLGRQLTVMHTGDMARLRQGVASTHGFLPVAEAVTVAATGDGRIAQNA
jgi:hypothetical protein